MENVLDHSSTYKQFISELDQAEGEQEWLPIEELFPTSAAQDTPNLPPGAPHLYPDPPDLLWWIALLLGIFTFGFFFQIWDIIQAAWMRRVDRSSIAIALYVAEAIVYLLKLPATWHNVAFNMFNGPRYGPENTIWISLLGVALLIASRFVLRRDLLRHFNRAEPIGLHLNWFLTLLFGGLYFQYHFNAINQVKRALRISVPTV